MNKNPQIPKLEAAWQSLLRSHPELAQLPEPDRPSPDYAKFKAFLEWAAETREHLDEPDRTMFDLSLQGLTHQQIGDKVYRSRGCVTGRLRKIMAKSQIPAADFRYFAAILQVYWHTWGR